MNTGRSKHLSVDVDSQQEQYNNPPEATIDSRTTLESAQMPNETMVRFGYPKTRIREYSYWVVLLREQQVTLGSLVLCSKTEARSFSNLPAEAFGELGTVVNDIERVLSTAFQYDKINYLMLMMVDPDVHFHVVPRYAKSRTIGGLAIADHGWPGAPKLDAFHALTSAERDDLRHYVENLW